MTTIAVLVAYKGEQFSGFARQPGQLTVQGELEKALSMIFRRSIEITGAGRTDSGVHARGQVVSFELLPSEWEERSPYKLLRSLNALTHEDLAVRVLEEKPAGFSARFSATMREYRYFISTDSYVPLFMRDFSWHLGKSLDVEAMQKAARYLIGEHDFKSFCLAASAEGKSTNRFVESIVVDETTLYGDHFVVIVVKGNAFLHSMVRTIVGTLVAVGVGNRTPEWVQDVLAAKHRSAAGENAPAKGLVFWQVSYEGERIHDPLYQAQHKKHALRFNGPKSRIAERKERARMPEFVIPRGDGSSTVRQRVASSGVYGEVILDEFIESFLDEGIFEADVTEPLEPVCNETPVLFEPRYPFQRKKMPVELVNRATPEK